MRPICLVDLNADIARACFDGVRGLPKERYHFYRRIVSIYGGSPPGLLERLDTETRLEPRTLVSHKTSETRTVIEMVMPSSLFIDLHKEVRRVLFEGGARVQLRLAAARR